MRLIDADELLNDIEDVIDIENDGQDVEKSKLIILGLKIAKKYIKKACTIEAETDNGWISVEDRLPEAIYDCLVWYSCDTPFGKSKSVDITYCSRGDWYTKDLNGDNIVVLYWLPFPKPPKGE